MIIYYGTRGKLKKDVSAGIDYCPNCNYFMGWCVGRSLKIWHICYIPIFIKTLKFLFFCGKCSYGVEIERADFFQMKDMYQPFKNRRQQIQFFEKADAMAKTLPPGEQSVQTIVSQLSSEYPICATPKLEAEYRRRLAVLLEKHGLPGQTPAAVSGAPAATATADAPPSPPQMDYL